MSRRASLISKRARIAFLVGIPLLGLLIWMGWPTNSVPDPKTDPLEEILPFLASKTLADMSPRKRYAYVNAVVIAHLEPQDQDRLIDGFSKLSDAQVSQIRDVMLDAIMLRLLTESTDYSQLTTPAKRKAFINAKVTEYGMLHRWADRMKDNPKVRQAVPKWDERTAYELIVKHTSPGQRAKMETYFADIVRGYLSIPPRERKGH